MAQKIRSKVEQALYDLQTARKMIKKAAEDLDSSISSRENRISWLEREVDLQEVLNDDQIQRVKEEYDEKLQDVIGVHVDEFIKGYHFEQFVVNWMYRNFKEYELKIWQGDKGVKACDGKLVKASWNMYPDLIFVNSERKKVIALECKYRNSGDFRLKKCKYEDYKNFETQIRKFMNVDVNVYIIVGNGSPETPSNIYCIPIDFYDDKFENTEWCTIHVDDLPQYKAMYWSKGEKNVTKNIPF